MQPIKLTIERGGVPSLGYLIDRGLKAAEREKLSPVSLALLKGLCKSLQQQTEQALADETH